MPFEDGLHSLHSWIWEQHSAAISRSAVFWAIHQIRSSLLVSEFVFISFFHSHFFDNFNDFMIGIQTDRSDYLLGIKAGFSHMNSSDRFLNYFNYIAYDSHWKLWRIKWSIEVFMHLFWGWLISILKYEFRIQWILFSQFHITFNALLLFYFARINFSSVG